MNAARLLRLPPDLPDELRSNIIHYYLDISWWGLYAGTTAAFLTIYATRVGATAAQIGLLNALPSAISLILSLPFGSVVRRMSAHRATYIGAFFSRFLFLPYALLPWLFPEKIQVSAIVIIAVLMTVPNVLVNIAFNQLLLEAIPSDWRGTVVGVRNAFFSIITFVVTLISGMILTRLTFPIGYQVIFVIGFVGGVATTYHLYKIRPLAHEKTQPPVVSQGVQRLPRYLPPVDGQGRRYIRVIGMLFVFNTVSNMVTPLVPGVLVNTLKLPDGWISLGTALNSLIVFIISLFIGRLTRRVGNRGGTAVGAVLLAAQAIVLALARSPAGYLASILVGGLGSGVQSTAQYNYHLDNVPQVNRSAWLSWNLLLGNAALLFGSLVGPYLAGWTGIPLALIAFGILRLVVGMVIYKWG